MTKSELILEVTEATGLRKRDVTGVIEAAFGIISTRLKKHEKVQLTGFGAFEPRRRRARVGVNPRTRATIKVGATWSLVFRPSKQLRRLVTGKAPRPGAQRRG